jgi:CheY-like chemotaxis protein
MASAVSVAGDPKPEAAGSTILVVEDEILVRLMIAEELRGQDYNVLEAASADEARSVLQSGVKKEFMASGLDHRDELPPEPADVAKRRQLRVHVVADRAIGSFVFALDLVARDLGSDVPQRAFARGSPSERKASEGELAHPFCAMEYDAANGRTAPLPPVGLGALADDAGDMAQPLFGFSGGTAFEKMASVMHCSSLAATMSRRDGDWSTSGRRFSGGSMAA